MRIVVGSLKVVGKCFLQKCHEKSHEKVIDKLFSEIENLMAEKRGKTTVEELQKWLYGLIATLNVDEDLKSSKLQDEVDDILSKVEIILEELKQVNTTTIPRKIQSEQECVRDRVEKLKLDLQFSKYFQEMKQQHSQPEIGWRESGARHRSTLYGRQREKQELVDFLFRIDEGQRNIYGVYTIVGMGGIGKTALAQHIFHDKGVKKSFDVKAWMCVWKRNRGEIYRGILEYITGDCCESFSNLSAAEKAIEKKLKNKRFLIVLDDAWAINRSEWDLLCEPFNVGKVGSKIVVTTRNVEFLANNVEGNKSLNLLQEKYCWNLLCERAGEIRQEDEGEIRKMLEKRDGLPQAIKEMGDILASNKEHWKVLLEENNLIRPNEGSTFANLKLSYDNLSKPWRNCFAFVGMLANQPFFEELETELKWSGAMLMKQSNDVCFRHLVSRSLFLPTINSLGKECFKMHPQMRDVALSVSNGKYCKWNDQNQSLDCRYMFCEGVLFKNCDRLLSSNKMQLSWRSFILVGESTPCPSSSSRRNCFKRTRIQNVNDVPYKCFDSIKTLRLFCFHGALVEISHMKHLRYVSLANSSFTELSCIAGFTYLEVLILTSCMGLKRLPDEVGDLVRLRYLDISGCNKMIKLPSQMNKLENLSYLIISSEVVSSLPDLSTLKGKLSIHGLEDLACISKHTLATLQFKDLSLEWKNSTGETDKNILGLLQPNQHVRKLSISGYADQDFPNWLRRMDSLEELIVENCQSSSISFFHLPKVLKLKINTCKEVNCCDELSLDTLKTLELLGTPSLGDTFKKKLILGSQTVRHLQLQDDYICGYIDRDYRAAYCFKMHFNTFNTIWNDESMPVESFTLYDSSIERLPPWIQNIKYVVIENCKNLTSISLQGEGLYKLRIANCRRLCSITPEEAIPSTLRYLEISYCDELRRVWASF